MSGLLTAYWRDVSGNVLAEPLIAVLTALLQDASAPAKEPQKKAAATHAQ